jgi:hypothetical protein
MLCKWAVELPEKIRYFLLMAYTLTLTQALQRDLGVGHQMSEIEVGKYLCKRNGSFKRGLSIIS